MPVGLIKFIHERGWGFIMPLDRSPDIYVSKVEAGNVHGGLRALMRVEYELHKHPITQRPAATKIKVIEEADQQERAAHATR